MKKIIIVAVIMGIFISSMISKVFLIANGKVHITALETFAVDSDESIYLGYRNRIDVYHNGELLRTIRPPTNRDYVLKVDGDKLLIGRMLSGKVGIYDFEGNFLEDIDLDYDTLKKDVSKENVIQQNGKSFKVNKFLGMKPFEVTCDDVVIYKMSTIDYIYNGLPAALLLAFTFLSMLILVPMLAFDERIRKFFR